VKAVDYRGRRAFSIESPTLEVVVSVEGGHIAAITHKPTGVNPLWLPPWKSIEPTSYSPDKHPEYGRNAESKLLCGILGHNLCLDLFGSPTPDEAALGNSVHGEANFVRHEFSESPGGLTHSCELPMSGLSFTRRLKLLGETLEFEETVRNLSGTDRPIGWTQHVTLGPPFLERGATRFDVPGTKCRTFESDFTNGKGAMAIAQTFDWPKMPGRDGKSYDLSTYWSEPVAAGYVAILMDPHRDRASFTARGKGVALTYDWKRTDFPWLGIWDECHAREHAPWNGRAMTRGMEFGASPFPETRRAMIERRELFGVPGYRWLPARGSATVAYTANLTQAR